MGPLIQDHIRCGWCGDVLGGFGGDVVTDEQYICKAVELADGWEINEHDPDWASGPMMMGFDIANPNLPAYIQQWELDALAAQLEREFNEWCLAHGVAGTVRWINYTRDFRKQPLGTDLTIWRIRYLVDLHE